MKNSMKRLREIDEEIAKRLRDSAATALHGFLTQAGRNRRFDPTVEGNELARGTLARLAKAAGYEETFKDVSRMSQYDLQVASEDISFAIWLGRGRLRALRAERAQLLAAA